MPESLKVPGRRIDPPSTPDDVSPYGVTTKVKYMIAVEPATRGAADEYQTLPDAEADSLIELEFQSGVRRWVSAAQLKDELRAAGTRGESGVLELPILLGVSGESIKNVAELVLDFPQYVADRGAREFVKSVEARLVTGPGLNRIRDPRLPGEQIKSPGDIQNGPLLLFIHGTASSTFGSFGDLSATAEWERLAKCFPDSIYALEHRTLSESPIENAIQAAALLPAGVTLNLVTHSRGGLVGELLCLPLDLTPEQRNIFGKERPKDQDDLQRLLDLLKEKQFKVDRFVRVACPARGTLLASKRLDLYLSVLLNLIHLLPLFQGNPFYEFVQATLKKLIALKADPYELPGLEAQMPDSPLIHLLNRPDITSQADLAVITGNSHGGAIFQALSTFAADIFFRQKHDFVVNTSAMYGGISRDSGGYYFDDSGTGVCHFHYFKNAKTRQQINAWLEAKSTQGSGEFIKLAYRERNLIFPGLRGANNLPALIFIPGLLGTHLKSGDDTIWLNSNQLLPGALDRIAFGEPVSAGAPLAYHQDQLLKDLNTSFAVTSFNYDWRLPLGENAAKLAVLIQNLLKESQTAVHLLAYSSGVMIVETLAAVHFQTWKEVRDRGGRAVLLGDTARAAKSADALARGTHKLVRLLQMLDRRPAAEIGKFFGDMPGVREAATWTANNTPAESMFPIAERFDLPFLSDTIRELLCYGTTDHTVSATPLENAEKEEDLIAPLLYPTEQDLADALFGVIAASGPEPVRIAMRAKHGHLREAEFPIAVGHYLGDGIVSAEKVIDRQLNGRLTENFQLDLYPGRDGTAEVFEAPDNQPPGALVIGLGEVGEIGADKVRRGIATAALRYALSRLRKAAPEAGRLSIGISSLLMGTYGGNALSVRDSVEAIAEGVVQANHSLRAQHLWDRVRIETLELVELYEDLAIQATHELIALEKRWRREAQAQPATLLAEREMKVAPGGLFHRPGNPYQNGWWRRIRVEAQEEGLAFTVLTDRARADFSLKRTQRELVTACVDKAVSAPRYDPDLARVLFDILLPKGIKDQIRDRTNLVFVVDRTSANFPWEMLAQRDGETVEPLANRVGLIRQLVSKDPPKLRTSRKLAATVVGAPFIKQPSRWPALPKASEEAQAVTEKLTDAGYQVNSLLEEAATPLAILAAVLADNRILHLAGHGVFNQDEPTHSGFVIGEDLYLSATEIANVEPVPELVFLNCCYGGSIPADVPGAGEPHRLAGTLATELIGMGVKAVVVSGWAVDDQAAKLFALDFYDALLGGLKFGDAVRRARSVTFDQFGMTNTWGAYQCYGNPDFALELNPNVEDSPAASPTAYVARRELLERVRNIEARAVDVDEVKKAKLLSELAAIDRTVAGKWDDGEMLFEIATAYAALQSNEDAEEAFRKAFAESKVPVKAIEELSNLLYRKAEKAKTDEEHEELFNRARHYLEWTLNLQPTVERLCFMGSLYKRESLWAVKKGSTEQKVENLRKALAWYKQAYQLEPSAYPALNVSAVQLMLGETGQEWSDRLTQIAARSARKAQEQSVWDRTGVIDAALLQEIPTNGLAQRPVQDGLIKRYQIAFQSATRRQRDTIVSQMGLIRDLLDPSVYPEEITGLTRLIEALEIKPR